MGMTYFKKITFQDYVLLVIALVVAVWGIHLSRAAVLSGELTSSVYDTGATSSINTIMWQGTLPTDTTVRFQIASSNCQNGATNAPTCNTGNWSYLGNDGSVSTYYTPFAPNVQVPLRASDHGSKRYFRYKLFMISDSDGVSTPTITNIIIGWSR